MTHKLDRSSQTRQQLFWYALFVRVNQEKRVAHHLAYREIEHFLPTYQWMRNWKDRRVTLHRPLFPGYVFIRLPLTERMKALTIPNVLSIVGTNGRPSVISREEISWIKRGIEADGVEPHVPVADGARVVITSGSLAGVEGTFLHNQNGHRSRILISINSISQAFLVEVPNESIEPVLCKIGPQRMGDRGFEVAP